MKAGFDGVELHGAFGYLNDGNGGLNQILESKDNPPERQINLFLTNKGWIDKL